MGEAEKGTHQGPLSLENGPSRRVSRPLLRSRTSSNTTRAALTAGRNSRNSAARIFLPDQRGGRNMRPCPPAAAGNGGEQSVSNQMYDSQISNLEIIRGVPVSAHGRLSSRYARASSNA